MKNDKWKMFTFFLTVFLPACSDIPSTTIITYDAEQTRPNILLIVVDDMGYSDLGSFGGEVPTPHLDQLANRGVRFSNFIASAACSPTRASLLTGVTPHKAGLGNLAEELAPNQLGQPGYEGELNQRVVTIATLLRDAGYHTYMTGKWHLGKSRESSPWSRGFERSFALLANASHFDDMRPAYSSDPDALALYQKDQHRLTSLPDNFSYSSQFFVDELQHYIDSADDYAPFFGMLAFTAPHWPIQAPDSSIAEFLGKYDVGYDAIAAERLGRLKTEGLIPANSGLAPRPPKGVPWNSLDSEQQMVETRAMEIYAAMIAEIDHNTGRLIDWLRAENRFKNTVVIFMSDNGAEGHDLDETWPSDAFPKIRQVIDESFDFSYESMGRPGSYTFLGPNWAHALAPAFNLHKGFASEGGLRTAAFMYSENEFDSATISDRLITPEDLAATILELAAVRHPGNNYRGKVVEPITGISILSGLQSSESDQRRVHINETIGKISVRKGDWKMTRMPAPYGNGDWQLFNLRQDLSETHDLAETHPHKVTRLIAEWEKYVETNGVILPDWLSGY
jgi:arylsulfatase A-like enzyme|tara:strand:+ start:13 stop:1704 length:1692 start_codon:yes stop_codon:yes gene_type:complete